MANSFVSPVNGREDTNVIPKSGGIAFDIPLYELETTGGASFGLSLKYKSALLKEDYGTWAPEAPENLIAAGWSLGIESRVFIIQKYPVKYGLYLNSTFYQLKKEKAAGNLIHYRTVSYSLLHIYYDTAKSEWGVFLEDGTLYLFGKNDGYTNEKGAFSAATGTFSEASKEYNGVRDLISHPNKQGIPSNANTDNTFCATQEFTLFGVNNWVGPTNRVQSMKPKPSAWLLSHIKDSFDNTISFSYVQHLSNLIGTDKSKVYSVASYLYRISVYCKSVCTEKITFEYGAKDTGEYSLDFIATPRPNGCQQKFETLFLKKLVHYNSTYPENNNTPVLRASDQTQLVTRLIKPAPNLVKRQLMEVQFLADHSPDIQTSPSYAMSYYGEQDGVSVGEAGFDDQSDLYFNAKTGAMFGALKTLTYPSGEMRKYQYGEQAINSVFTTFSDTLPSAKDPIVIPTPFNYTIMVFPDPVKVAYSIYVYTMDLDGWHKTLLCTRKVIDGYEYERLISYSEHMVGIIAPRSDNVYYAAVFSKNPENNKWSENMAAAALTGDPNKMHISVSDDGIAYTYETAAPELGKVVYAPTSDYGKTFGTKRQLSLQNYIVAGNNYRILIKVLETKCLAFVMTRLKLSSPLPPKYFASATDTYDNYYLKVAGIRSDGRVIGVSDLGWGKMANHVYEATETPEFYSYGYVMSGGAVEKAVSVDLIGNFFVLRFKTKGLSIWYLVREDIKQVFQRPAAKTSDWSLVLFHSDNMERFSVLDDAVMKQVLERKYRVPDSQYISNSVDIDTSVQVSENGMILTIHYGPDHALEKYITTFCTYLGGNNADFKVQANETDNLLACLAKDNMFATFQSRSDQNVYTKKYLYYDPASAAWSPIYTGTVTSPSTTYNHSAESVLHAISILGIIMSIALFPFGLSSTAGIICTALSAGLFIAAEATSAILQDSFKTSLNLEAAFFGNRFINDGTTIWFRDQHQNRLTAIGSGSLSQPFDILNDEQVIGNILSDKQQFGCVYNFVPFFTDQKKMYYRSLKNDSVGPPIPLGGLSVGCNDLYLDSNNTFRAYKDNFIYSFNAQGHLLSKEKDTQNKLPYVDACCIIKNKAGTETIRVLIAGQKAIYLSSDTINRNPESMTNLFKGTRFHHVDCALEKLPALDDEASFYLFSNREYEVVRYTFSINQFDVTERGSLDQYLKSRKINRFPFDKIDAAYEDKGTVYIRKNRFIKYSNTGSVSKQGRLGNDWFIEDMDINNMMLSFNHNTLFYYRKSTGDFQLYQYLGGSLNEGVRNYVVDRVSFCQDPRSGKEPDSVTFYKYYTDSSTYVPSTGSCAYSQVDVCIMEDEQ